MSRDDGFLSRWSRLKQQAAQPAPMPAKPADTPADRAEADARAATEAAEREAAEARERDAVLARLPKLEDLRVDSDFSGFMHPLVPAPLRSAALARLWMLDPAIRTYEDPARDYAWNWNVPGGAPGGGPPPTAEEVESTLKTLFKRFETEERVADLSAPPAEVPDASAAEAEKASGASEETQTPEKPEVKVATADAIPAAEVPASRPAIEARRDDSVPDLAPRAAPAEPAVQAIDHGPDPDERSREAPRRRHGGARPV